MILKDKLSGTPCRDEYCRLPTPIIQHCLRTILSGRWLQIAPHSEMLNSGMWIQQCLPIHDSGKHGDELPHTSFLARGTYALDVQLSSSLAHRMPRLEVPDHRLFLPDSRRHERIGSTPIADASLAELKRHLTCRLRDLASAIGARLRYAGVKQNSRRPLKNAYEPRNLSGQIVRLFRCSLIASIRPEHAAFCPH